MPLPQCVMKTEALEKTINSHGRFTMMCHYWVISLIVSEALESIPFDIVHSLFSIGIWSRVISQANDCQYACLAKLIDSSQ